MMSGTYTLPVPLDLSDRLADLEVEAAGEAASAATDSAWWSSLATLMLVLGLVALAAFWIVAILPGRSVTLLLVVSVGSATMLVAWTTANPRQAAAAARRRHDVWSDLTRQARQQRRAAAGEGSFRSEAWTAYQWLLTQRDALRSGTALSSPAAAFVPDFDRDEASRKTGETNS